MGAIRKGLVTCRPCIRPARGHQVVGPLVNVNVTRLCPPSLCFRPRYNRGKRLRYRPPLCVSAPQDEYADAHIVLLTSRGRSLLQEDAIQKVGGGGVSLPIESDSAVRCIMRALSPLYTLDGQ